MEKGINNNSSVQLTEDIPDLLIADNTKPTSLQNTTISSTKFGKDIENPNGDFGIKHKCIPRPIQKYAGMILALIASLLFSAAVNTSIHT